MLKTSWIAFALMLAIAVIFVTNTAPQLPPMVASHFDLAGYPNAFMTHRGYTRFILGFAVGLPIAIVALLTFVYAGARDFKLPNRDYWLAPERIARTRAILIAHGVWFGSLLVAMVCFVHWLELQAHQRKPPQLPHQLVSVGLLVFFLITAAWIIVLLRAFRLPRAGGSAASP
jgi:uncharacterized membrane protein